jgi:rod shape-determining protein MreD
MLSLIGRPTVRLTLVAFVILGIQTTLFADMKPFGVTADLMLLGATAAGAVAGPQRGALAGFIFGLMFDFVLVTPFGVSALVYGLAGFLAGLVVHSWTSDPTWWLTLLVVAGCSAGAVIGLAVAGTFVGLEGAFQSGLFRTAIIVGLIDGVLAPLAMPVQRWCFGIKRAIV